MSPLDTLNRHGLAILADMQPAPVAARSFAAILLDLDTVHCDRRALDRRIAGRELTTDEDATWTQLEDREEQLRVEAAAEFRRVAGVDWRVAERVLA